MNAKEKRRMRQVERVCRRQARNTYPDLKKVDVHWHGSPLEPIVFVWRNWEDGYRGRAHRPKLS